MDKLRTRVRVGVVGGSDLVKIKEQMGGDYCEYTIHICTMGILICNRECFYAIRF